MAISGNALFNVNVRLPQELVHQILLILKDEDIDTLSQVSKIFNKIIQSDEFWQRKVSQAAPDLLNRYHAKFGSWKNYYIRIKKEQVESSVLKIDLGEIEHLTSEWQQKMNK